MQYGRLGSTGLVVSRLSFGAMTFSREEGGENPIWKTGSDTAIALVNQALDGGINFFDTADVYAGGESEQLLGEALKSRRDEAVIATKCGHRSGPGLIQAGLSRRHIEWTVAQSLKRLQTDFVDVLVAHREDPLTPLEETLEALNDIVRAGKARYLAFSNWSAWKVAAALEMQRANGWAPFTHGQVYYSLVGRDVERDYFPLAAHYGIGLTVWSPLAGGMLTGRYQADAQDPGRMANFDTVLFEADAASRVMECVHSIAGREECSPAQVAIAWLLSKEPVASVIVGASKTTQLTDNLGAAELALSAEDLAMLDEAAPPAELYPQWQQKKYTDPVALEAVGRDPSVL